MNVFILYAHPEPELSFNAALLKRSVDTLTSEGHDVIVSDLYKMNFNPVASESDFSERRFPDRLQYDREQKYAVQHNALSNDIAAEIEKVQWCDLLIMQFPLYWFSMPAIMKGWFDRVFVNSLIYGANKRYETGGLKGRKAMLTISAGAYESMFQSNGLLGDLDIALWPIHNGILHYTGFEVLPPFMSWSPVHNGQQACDKYLDDYAERLRHLDQQKPLEFHPQKDFGDDFLLKPGVTPRSTGHH